jgi:hypothetical protein
MADEHLRGVRLVTGVGHVQDCNVFFVVSGYPYDHRGADEEALVLMNPS